MPASDFHPKPLTNKLRLEMALDNMHGLLRIAAAALPRTRRYNLSPAQRHCLSELRKRDDLVIFPTDKNLGPSVAPRHTYIKQVLSEHLLNTSNYEAIPPHEAATALKNQRDNFTEMYETFKETLPTPAETTYFRRSLAPDNLDNCRTPQFYGSFKVHKDGPAKPLRPIISSVGSVSEIFSKWVDHWLKKVVKDLVPTYIRDSEHLISEMRSSFPDGLPPGAKLFSVDAVSMYSNIDTDHGIEVIRTWLSDYSDQLPADFPTDFIVAALSEVMRNNIFQFGDTFWRQLSGCAMGTSSAVNYAVLYVGLLEIKRLLRKYRSSMPFYKRFIDDGIGVFVPPKGDPTCWQNFFDDLNNWGKLKWTCDGHLDTLVFLDLTISINPDRSLHFRTFQKEMNLYLYIPPLSAHPDSTLRSLIYGRLRAYRLHNTSNEDFIAFSKLLVQRLSARGWPMSTLAPLFQAAYDDLLNADDQRAARARAAQLDATLSDPLELDAKPIIFHLPYHPRGIQRKTIRKLYDATVGPHIPDRKLIVAVSRPRNLRDRLCSAVLRDVPGENPSDMLATLANTNGGDRPHSPPLFATI